jgi:hypothetical protein
MMTIMTCDFEKESEEQSTRERRKTLRLVDNPRVKDQRHKRLKDKSSFKIFSDAFSSIFIHSNGFRTTRKTMIDAKNNKAMYRRAGFTVCALIFVLCYATNCRCLNEDTTLAYTYCFCFSIILLISIIFLILNALECLKASADDPHKRHFFFPTASLGCNTLALTQMPFSQDNTFIVIMTGVALFTLAGMVFSIMTIPKEEMSEEKKHLEDNEYALLVDEEMD